MSQAESERLQAAQLPPGNMIRVLLTQHAQIGNLFAAVRDAAGDERQERFDDLRELLAVHEAGEEAVLRPISRKDAGLQVANARNEEENEAAHVLAHLEKMDVADPRFLDRLTEFEHAVSHHAEREENEEFPPVLADHSEEELQALGGRLLKAEKNAPTHPHPTAAGSPTAQRVVGPFTALLDKARDNFKH